MLRLHNRTVNMKYVAIICLVLAVAFAVISMVYGYQGDDWVACSKEGGVLILELDTHSYRCAEKPVYINMVPNIRF